MVTLQDGRITEASGIAASLQWDDQVVITNDEDGKHFIVRPSTGETIGTISVKNGTLVDPESLSIDAQGVFHVWDIGDNSANHPFVRLYTRGEPGPGKSGQVAFTKYKLVYPGGPRNAECGLTHPDGRRFIVTKQATGRLFQLPASLTAGTTNTLTDTGINMPANVTDGCISKDGAWAFFVRDAQLTTIYVHETATWTSAGTITMPSLPDPEGIAVSRDGLSLYVVSEGPHTTINTVAIPGAWTPPGSPVSGAPAAPAEPINPCTGLPQSGPLTP